MSSSKVFEFSPSMYNWSCINGAHLHFEVWRDGRTVDPLLEMPTGLKE
jgi:hypothetical protein